MNWTPVSRELPPKGNRVLAAWGHRVGVARYTFLDVWVDDGTPVRNVPTPDFWAPLPLAPFTSLPPRRLECSEPSAQELPRIPVHDEDMTEDQAARNAVAAFDAHLRRNSSRIAPNEMRGDDGDRIAPNEMRDEDER